MLMSLTPLITKLRAFTMYAAAYCQSMIAIVSWALICLGPHGSTVLILSYACRGWAPLNKSHRSLLFPRGPIIMLWGLCGGYYFVIVQDSIRCPRCFGSFQSETKLYFRSMTKLCHSETDIDGDSHRIYSIKYFSGSLSMPTHQLGGGNATATLLRACINIYMHMCIRTRARTYITIYLCMYIFTNICK